MTDRAPVRIVQGPILCWSGVTVNFQRTHAKSPRTGLHPLPAPGSGPVPLRRVLGTLPRYRPAEWLWSRGGVILPESTTSRAGNVAVVQCFPNPLLCSVCVGQGARQRPCLDRRLIGDPQNYLRCPITVAGR